MTVTGKFRLWCPLNLTKFRRSRFRVGHQRKDERNEGQNSKARRQESCQGSGQEGRCKEEEVRVLAAELAVRRTIAYAAGILAVLPWTSSATPASLTNRDNRDHTVTILEKAQASVSRTLKPEETLQGICRKGCIVRLDGSERHEFVVEGNELLSIEGGDLYLDGVEPSPSPDQIPTTTPAPAAPR